MYTVEFDFIKINILKRDMKEGRHIRYGWHISDNYAEETYIFTKKEFDSVVDMLPKDELYMILTLIDDCNTDFASEVLENLRTSKNKEIIYADRRYTSGIEEAIHDIKWKNDQKEGLYDQSTTEKRSIYSKKDDIYPGIRAHE